MNGSGRQPTRAAERAYLKTFTSLQTTLSFDLETPPPTSESTTTTRLLTSYMKEAALTTLVGTDEEQYGKLHDLLKQMRQAAFS
jgi:hypothetical protein